MSLPSFLSRKLQLRARPPMPTPWNRLRALPALRNRLRGAAGAAATSPTFRRRAAPRHAPAPLLPRRALALRDERPRRAPAAAGPAAERVSAHDRDGRVGRRNSLVVLNAGDPLRNIANTTTTTLLLLASKIYVCVLVALFLKGAPVFRTDLSLNLQHVQKCANCSRDSVAV